MTSRRRSRWLLLVLGVAPRGGWAQERPPTPPTSPALPAFDLGVGVGYSAVGYSAAACRESCPAPRGFSAGPLLAVGVRVHPRWVVLGQIVGAAGEIERVPTFIWSIMPAVKYYPGAGFYVAVGAGVGQFGAGGEDEVTATVWSVEGRVGYTVPKRPVLTPYVGVLASPTHVRLRHASGIERPATPAYVHVGLSLSYRGGAHDHGRR